MRRKLILPGLILAAFALMTGFFGTTTQATVPPKIEGGDIYRVKNVTKGSAYANTTNADKCEELQYRVQIHNPGPDLPLNGVVVKASIPGAASNTNTSTVTVSASNASSVTDTATVNLSSSQKVTYVPGSTQLLGADGSVISALGDVTSGAGANVGNVGISINQQRFVVFKAKVDCPETPPPPVKKFDCKALNATVVSRTQFNFTAVAFIENVTIQSYRFTAKGENGATVDEKTVTTNAQTADYQFNQSTPGTYYVTAVINTDAGSTNPDKCKKKVTVVEEGKPPVPPEDVPPETPITPAGVGTPTTPGAGSSPTMLPETGAAGTVAIVLLVASVSGVGYYVVTTRFNLN